jgi:exonuclease III
LHVAVEALDLPVQLLLALDEHAGDPAVCFAGEDGGAPRPAGEWLREHLAAREPLDVWRIELGDDTLDSKGRWVEADIEVEGETLTVVSAYVFTGEAETPAKQDPKWAFLDAMERRMSELSADGALALVTGDLNVGHRPLDIRNWKGNVKKAGFLARERAYFDRILTPAGAPVAKERAFVSGPGAIVTFLADRYGTARPS